MANVFILYFVHFFINLLRQKEKPRRLHYAAVFMEVLLLGYERLAEMSLKLMHCVSIGSRKWLFIDGNVPCLDCKRQLRKTGREIDWTNKELLGAITNFLVSLGILASFRWEKNWHKSMFSFFCNFTKLYGLSYHGSNNACPIQFYFGA